MSPTFFIPAPCSPASPLLGRFRKPKRVFHFDGWLRNVAGCAHVTGKIIRALSDHCPVSLSRENRHHWYSLDQQLQSYTIHSVAGSWPWTGPLPLKWWAGSCISPLGQYVNQVHWTHWSEPASRGVYQTLHWPLRIQVICYLWCNLTLLCYYCVSDLSCLWV